MSILAGDLLYPVGGLRGGVTMAQDNGWRPRPLRAVLLLGAAALALGGAATGVLTLPVAGAACLATAVVVPRSRRAETAADPQRGSEATGTLDGLDVSLASKSLLEAIAGRVPPEVLDRVVRICQLVIVGLQSRAEAGNGDPGTSADPDVYRLRQTVLSYLPDALDAYLAVPGIYAGRSLGGRKSPRQTLEEQLDLIEAACRRLTEGGVAAETDRLEAHGRFLQATLGRSAMSLDAAPVPVPAPTSAAVSASPAPEAREAQEARERVR